MAAEFSRPGASEIWVPRWLDPKQGWAPGMEPEEALTRERKAIEHLQQSQPVAFARRAAVQVVPEILAKWMEFQESRGRHAGSCDMTLLEDFAFGRNFAWEDQFIGSCVIANTFRGWVKRGVFQIALAGQPQEYLGFDEFGPLSIAPYAPWSYGMMRRRGGLRSGDGGFCEPMGESLLLDGVLPCSSPLLAKLLKQLGADAKTDMPEPRSNEVYRAFGAWKYLDELAPDATCRLDDTDSVESLEDHVEFSEAYKPMFQCSSIAIKKAGTHKDGFPIHVQDHGNRWDHNMGWQGFFISSDGRRFHRLSNESWGDEIIYNIEDDELDEWYRNRRTSTMTIGNIGLQESVALAG